MTLLDEICNDPVLAVNNISLGIAVVGVLGAGVVRCRVEWGRTRGLLATRSMRAAVL